MSNATIFGVAAHRHQDYCWKRVNHLLVTAMASGNLDRLRNEALNLPEAERARLACELVQSLDGPADADVAKEWEAEILRRLDSVDSENTQIIDRAEFSRRMRERLARL